MSYTAENISVLEGLEPVRKRPGMYIGGTGSDGLHHLIWEIVDNAVDEVINGYATTVHVTLHSDGKSISVKDNGRGIPIDIHPKVGVPALQVILTTLHAGGKFDQGSYITSGGLHGVGSSVVNALSEQLVATIRRDGNRWQQQYKRGKVKSELIDLGPCRGTGTEIQFTPDSKIFDVVEFDAERILKRLEVSAYLNKGLKIVFLDEANQSRTEIQHEGGVSDFLAHIAKGSHIIPNSTFFHNRTELPRIDIALCWTDTTSERIRSFVNGVPTPDGGTHEQGLKDAILRSVRAYIETNSVSIPRGIKLSAEDIREGVTAICSIFIPDPQFQGQTKDKLNNPEVRAQIEGMMRPLLSQWMLNNQSIADALITRMVLAAKARQASRAASSSVRRKSATNRRLNLPGKLADCSVRDASLSELFIVEGDSAGGSAKQGRDRRTQAILPLRGKVLNTEQATLKKILANKEISDIINALGCGIGKDFNLDHLRYNKIILLMDADQDGYHIATLLLTFFYRHMRPLIDHGHIYLAQPPLYKIVIGNKTHWVNDDREKDKLLKKVSARQKPSISRFKGLGEMMPKTLFQTTLDPKRRTLLQVDIPEGSALDTENIISDLMGKDVKNRYHAIMNFMAVVDFVDV
ncbi:MAG: DNA gyrase/topoisomerase IV subunit B [Myxococcota bacterium]